MAISNRDTNAGARAWTNTDDATGMLSGRSEDGGARAWRNNKSGGSGGGGTGGSNHPFEMSMGEPDSSGNAPATLYASYNEVLEAVENGGCIYAIAIDENTSNENTSSKLIFYLQAIFSYGDVFGIQFFGNFDGTFMFADFETNSPTEDELSGTVVLRIGE